VFGGDRENFAPTETAGYSAWDREDIGLNQLQGSQSSQFSHDLILMVSDLLYAILSITIIIDNFMFFKTNEEFYKLLW
jgi:hypothetical protein